MWVNTAERDVLGMLCEELPQLRAECALLSADHRSQLTRIEDEARARRPVLALLARLLQTEQEQTRQALSTGLPGAGPGRAAEERFGCPDGACGRTAFSPYPAGPIPRCAVTDQPMRRQ